MLLVCVGKNQRQRNNRREAMRRHHALCLLSLYFLLAPLETTARQTGFIAPGKPQYSFIRDDFCSRPRHGLNARRDDTAGHPNADRSRVPRRLVQALDLAPVIRTLSNHAGTRRGREAILGLIGEEQEAERPTVVPDDFMSSKRKRVTRARQSKSNKEMELSLARESLAPIASSAEQAREEYELVEQATLALEGVYDLAVPPIYGATSSPWDTDTKADTDHDEWLTLPLEDWTLEYILQADQVMNTLLLVHEWGNLSETQTWLPGLSDIAQTIAEVDLRPAHNEIQGAVEIVTKRSVVNAQPLAYKFQLSEDRFPVLTLLREKEQTLRDTIEKQIKAVLRKLKGSTEVLEYEGRMVICVPKSQANVDLGITRGSTDNGRRCYIEPRSVVKEGDELVSIQKELNAMETDIKQGLMNAILKASSVIDRGVHTMARLDVVLAKAAFGSVLNGNIPKVRHDGQISVKNFIHPVLLLRKSMSNEDPVPVDLFLSHDQGSHALIISGPNGGGKTIALKSFGMSSLLAKLSIPIPQAQKRSSDVPPRVDFFDNVLVEVGDQQSVLEGESTLMAKLNAYSSIIESVVADCDPHTDGKIPGEPLKAPDSSLVLMDELGGGTDPTAGGTIAQAIMEKLLESDNCRIVATTHSPQLKALSYNSTQYNCATVLLKSNPSSDYKLPSYKLEYGKIGDSYALGAASRCFPPLPEDVLNRAASLMASSPSDRRDRGEKDDVSYLRALTSSLEEEKEAVNYAKTNWESNARELQECRKAMASLAEAYTNHLNGVENRLQDAFRELRDDESKNAVEVVGETLETLKLVKKKVKTEEELLKERGLRKVSPDHEFQDGDSVVILTPGEYEGTSATVLKSDLLDNNDVAVLPFVSMWDDPFFSLDRQTIDNTSTTTKPLIVKRTEVAVWDTIGVWDDFEETDSPTTSIRESRQRLASVLSKLKTSPNEAKQVSSGSQGKAFKSSRERKAAKRKRK